jgi:hypothetical protein
MGYVDSLGTYWWSDREYAVGSWGHFNGPLIWGTGQRILGTNDPALFQTQRYGDGGSFGYRFDVPNGRYEVELWFAEIFFDEPGERVFDVLIELQPVFDNLDVVAQAGGAFRALIKRFEADVSDEQLNVGFVRDWANGRENPIVNAIRVTKLE